MHLTATPAALGGDLVLSIRLGQGRESEVFLSHFNGKPVAVKHFRRPAGSPQKNPEGGSQGMLGQNQKGKTLLPTNVTQIPTRSQVATIASGGGAGAGAANSGGGSGRGGGGGGPAIRSMLKSGKIALDAADTLASFSNEVTMLMALRHPNVIKMLGYGSADQRYFMIVEYMPKGSVFELLASAEHIDVTRKWQMAMDAANGIGYLHDCKPAILHKDLKSLNLLVADDGTIKVADFGIAMEMTATNIAAVKQRSKAKSEAKRSSNDLAQSKGGDDGMAGHGGTLQWMAPELLVGREPRPSLKTDVFAFGVILWEITTRRKPWQGVNSRVISESVVSGSRLPKSDAWPQALRAMVDACWHQDAGLRPSMASVRRDLHRIKFPMKV
eukprot:jgi/Hompol1/6382/HPOL_000766-RA